MTRSELIHKLSAAHPLLALKDVDLAVRVILDTMAEALAQGGRVEVRDFGSFALNHRPPRAGRNPKTGTKVAIPARSVPHFKPGLALRQRVNRR